MADEDKENVEIRVSGTVQGVGFRPAVWRLAHEEGLLGEVFNDSFGVLIRTAGTTAAISRFVRRLQTEAPPLSKVEAIELRPLTSAPGFKDFRIAESVGCHNRTRVTPDAAICAACRAEVLNPTERRYQYSFANCTHCGPRFSIVIGVPYDRARTSMATFPMCAACAEEYHQPLDRRFHAQAIACPVCGPEIWLESAAGEQVALARGTEALEAAQRRLSQGEIVAIRGLGGFHLACDAGNARAVAQLRNRKRRYAKPFALMARDLEMIERYCNVTSIDRELLQSAEAPIVLLSANGGERLADGLAPGSSLLGFMLPYTPLHFLITQHLDQPLVMTSGNVSDEPQVTESHHARIKLRGIADAFLIHNRDIANRIDDSVVRVMAGKPRLLRRARGYAPGAFPLPPGFEAAPDLLAYGGELKATFCLLKDGAAILSQHQGDLEEVSTFEDYQKNLRLYSTLYEHQPRLLAVDRHPDYLSTKMARNRAATDGLPVFEIQHHHAHIASCLAENGVPMDAPPVLGVALDGLGLGEDGNLWGGEFLLADYRNYTRLGAFKPVAMPGGAQAIREPWRNTYAHLAAAMGWMSFAEQFATLELHDYLKQKPLQTIEQMLTRGINSPMASSCGRLFDAVAAALGLCRDRAQFEGQGAMELEAAAMRSRSPSSAAYPFGFTDEHRAKLRWMDPTRMWWALFEDLRREEPVAEMAARFHTGLAIGITEMVRDLRRTCSPSPMTVVLSGGCWQNKLLLEQVACRFESEGIKCLLHADVPPNDGGLALGQAAVAAARWLSPQEGKIYSQPH